MVFDLFVCVCSVIWYLFGCVGLCLWFCWFCCWFDTWIWVLGFWCSVVCLWIVGVIFVCNCLVVALYLIRLRGLFVVCTLFVVLWGFVFDFVYLLGA